MCKCLGSRDCGATPVKLDLDLAQLCASRLRRLDDLRIEGVNSNNSRPPAIASEIYPLEAGTMNFYKLLNGSPAVTFSSGELD